MRVRHKETGEEATFSRYNLHGVGEFVAVFDDGSASSEMLRDWEPEGSQWPDDE